jgi:hypothetical protein
MTAALQAYEQTQVNTASVNKTTQTEVTTIGQLPAPDSAVTDRIWLIVILAFAVVLVGSFLTLAVSTFLTSKNEVDLQIILTIFTTVTGFLAGLFTTSPAQAKKG